MLQIKKNWNLVYNESFKILNNINKTEIKESSPQHYGLIDIYVQSKTSNNFDFDGNYVKLGNVDKEVLNIVLEVISSH